MSARELEARMRAALLALAMTSNGRTTSYNPGGGGERDYALVDDRGRGRLGAGDAPQLEYAARWDRAVDDVARLALVEEAEHELEQIVKSRAPAPKASWETAEQLAARIVAEGAGWPAKEAAIAFRTGVTDVWRARKAAGRDVEYGQPLVNGRALSREQLRVEILRLADQGMSTRVIADALGVARGSIRYVLARAQTKPTGRRGAP